jgi:hypothetical protein
LETWRDGCLDRIESDTNANGKPFYVRGEQENQNLVVDNGKEQQALGGCVMSFAYWNPEFLKASRLLNTQNGEYLDVDVDELLPVSVEVDGKVEKRSHYRLKAKDLAMELWYSEKESGWLCRLRPGQEEF